jgi:class 3 adenylate cyclase
MPELKQSVDKPSRHSVGRDASGELAEARPAHLLGSRWSPPQCPRLTITDVDYPLYLTNANFEVEWCNGPAMALFEAAGPLSDEIKERNLFKLFLASPGLQRAESRDELIHFHLAIAKNRMAKEDLRRLGLAVGFEEMARLERACDGFRTLGRGSLPHMEVNLSPAGEAPRIYDLCASFFREGIFFAYVPSSGEREGLLQFLSRREVVIRDILKKRRPYLTPLAVAVADLQNSVRICAELPPEEYFELINTIWARMEPILRRYHGTHGKHVGDGILCYFFPQPDCNYLVSAVHCAFAMKQAMEDIDTAWRHRKNWANRLVLNTGVHEGHEWFGIFETPTHLQFTVLGETINYTARLSDFAHNGAIWTTKNLLSKLTPEEREKIRYGVRRRGESGEITVSNIYARIADLMDLADPKNHKLRDIATLNATEIHDVRLCQAADKADCRDSPLASASAAIGPALRNPAGTPVPSNLVPYHQAGPNAGARQDPA